MSEVDGPKRAIVRRPFTPEEDVRLMEIMRLFPFTNWESVAQQMGDRTSRQVRERWVNYLSPDIRNEPWTESEDQLLLEKINELGRCWSTIGRHFNGRSENDVKNRWYSHLRYRTIEDGYGQLHFADPSQTPFPSRKKRNRAKISPKQNALRMMEQQRRVAARQVVYQPVIVPVVMVKAEQPVPVPQTRPAQQGRSFVKVEQQAADVTHEFESFIDPWDYGLLDDVAFDKFSIEDVQKSLEFF